MTRPSYTGAVLTRCALTVAVIFAMLSIAHAQSGAMAAAGPLTDDQVAQAIALGQAKTVPTVHVGASHDFDVYIDGPVARIGKAAARAAKQLRPFEVKDVPASLRSPGYVVTVLSTANGLYLAARHIALQSKGATGADGLVQSIAEDGDVDSTLVGREATFDHVPEGEFDIVVATLDADQRFAVTAAMRAQIR
jgi:hypothetical protein